MKSFLNFIRKNGLYAFINLFGLTVSLAFGEFYRQRVLFPEAHAGPFP